LTWGKLAGLEPDDFYGRVTEDQVKIAQSEVGNKLPTRIKR
jgi:hypothetical protein